MKAAPVVIAAAGSAHKQLIIHTGQHYDAALSEVFFEQLELPKPDRNLGVGSGSHAEQTAALMTALEETFAELGPRLVVVYGDVNSTLAATLVAAKSHIPVAHVEAGLRSFDRTMPEEVNRVVTDSLADLLLATSEDAIEHLTNEGVARARIHLVGNPMIDTLLRFRDRLDPLEASRHGVAGPYGVVTLHRPRNVDNKHRAQLIVDALHAVAADLPLLIPLHPRGRDMLLSLGLGSSTDVKVLDPAGYLEFMSLVAHSDLVITDSGGIQEETSILGVPCLTVRPNTERPITVTQGTNQLVEPSTIADAAKVALAAQWAPAKIPLWDGRAGVRIASVLEGFLA